MKSILFFFDHFYPAFRSGGPIRSSIGLVENLSTLFKIHIITQNHDVGDSIELPGIRSNQWNSVKSVKVFYASQFYYLRNLPSIVKTIDFDIYHFNSFFSILYTIFPLLLIKTRILPSKPVIITPRGEFSSGALNIKPFKKRLYLFFYHLISRKITYHATSEIEKEEILKVLGRGAQRVIVAPDTRSISEFEKFVHTPSSKEENLLKAVFIARISRIKNLEFCVEVLRHINRKVIFHFYGLLAEQKYFEEVLRAAKALDNPNVQLEYKGELLQHEVVDIIKKHDIFFFPSKSESFGHVILEALIASRPVLISDQTYWRNLEPDNAGWDIPLSNKERFIEVIETLCSLDSEEFEKYTKGAFQKAKNYLNDPRMIESYKELYNRVN